jgi:NAD(P)-dependent dehydrogenase (short-subunit alcohol dehydrogenase family)
VANQTVHPAVRTPWSATSTAREVIDGVDLTGQRALVSGAASGIGLETARALAQAGAEVTLAVRDTSAGQRVARVITASTGNERLAVARLDLADQDSIAALTSGWAGPLHILVNNAGIMACPPHRTTEGWELQFATNHLGHFALTCGLHEALASAGGARVVSVSSAGHLRSPVVFEDIMFTERDYEPLSAYGQSKTANILFAVEASKRWAGDGITVNSLMPGAIQTGLQRHLGDSFRESMMERVAARGDIVKTPEQGAATSVMLAVSPLLTGIGGRYFEDGNEAPINEPDTLTGVARYAIDLDNAARLWAVSAGLVGLAA